LSPGAGAHSVNATSAIRIVATTIRLLGNRLGLRLRVPSFDRA
jgi:hypothetical protein